ncbi:MAG: amino acid permease [Chloroherpetonaceae bacterium]|nr:amino acid permease [Chloroherpetonaceae bacterium]
MSNSESKPISHPVTEFKRELGLWSSTMIVVGSMVGSGIFIVSADIARSVGSPGWLLMVWLITGLVTLIAALSYGELAAMMPHAGGQYVYLKESYNPLIGFLYGWTLFLVIQTGTIAAVAVAFAKFTAVFFPVFSEENILFSIGNIRISAAQILAIGSLVLLTGINLRGVKEAKWVQDTFTGAKSIALFALIVVGIFLGKNEIAVNANFHDFWSPSSSTKEGIASGLSIVALISAIGVAMVGSLFSSDAWNNITFTAGEVKDPEKNIPLSLFFGTAIVTAIYILANIAYLLVLPLKGMPDGATVIERGIQFATSERVATAVVSVIFGDAAVLIMAALIMVSTFGCNNGLILAGARVYYAMSKDGLFFKKAGELSSKSVPSWALIVQTVWASLLCLSGSYGQLLDYVIFAVLLFYILTIGGVFILRAKRPEVPRPYKAFGYPILPAIYIIIASIICVILLIKKPEYTFPGLGIVLLGIPVFYWWRSQSKSTQAKAK